MPPFVRELLSPAATHLKYDAFVSYSHKGEHGIAQSIERTLWSFGRRWYQRRRIRTFRDESNLAAQPDLWPTIENAIRESNCLVLLASPDSARSEWVPREVEAFVSQHGLQGLCLVQTEGELPWNSNLSPEEIFSNGKAAITERMWRMFVDAGAEPIVVDLRRFRSMPQRQLTRNPEYMSAIAAIAAKVLNTDKDVIWGEYLRSERRQRTMFVTIACVLLGLVIALGISYEKQVIATREAQDQRDIARSRELSAKSLLASNSDPELGILLSREALSAARTAEAETALRRSMEKFRAIWTLQKQSSAGISSDGTRVVATSLDGALRILDAKTGRVLQSFSGAEKYVASPTLNRVIALKQGSAPLVLEVTTGKELFNCGTDDSSAVWRATFDQNGDRILLIGKDGVFHFWNAGNGAPLKMTAPFPEKFEETDIVSPNLRWFYTRQGMWDIDSWRLDKGRREGIEVPPSSPFAFAQNKAFENDSVVEHVLGGGHGGIPGTAMTDIPTGATIIQLIGGTVTVLDGGHISYIRSAAFNRDGRLVATTSEDKTAVIWDVAAKRQVQRLIGHDGWVRSASFSDDNRRIVTVGQDHTARVWQIDGGTQIASIGSYDFLTAALDPAGNHLLSVDSSGLVRWWDVTPSNTVTLARQPGAISAVAFTQDDTAVVTAGESVPRNCSAATGECARSFDTYGTTTSLAITPDGGHFLAGTGGGVSVYSFSTPRVVQFLPALRRTDSVVTLGLSRDGSIAVGSTSEDASLLWSLVSPGQPKNLLGGSVGSQAISGDARAIVTWTNEPVRAAYVSDAITGQILQRLAGHQKNITAAAFEPSGSLLVTTSEDKTARVWNSKTGKIEAIMTHDAPVVYGEFSISGKSITTMTSTGRLHVWTRSSGWKLQETLEIGATGNEEAHFVLSPDGRWLATWSWENGEITVWDVAAGQQITKIVAHAAGISSVVFSHDSRSLVSGSFDGTAQIYDCMMCLSVEELSREAEKRGLREWADGERAANIGDTSALPRKSVAASSSRFGQ